MLAKRAIAVICLATLLLAESATLALALTYTWNLDPTRTNSTTAVWARVRRSQELSVKRQPLDQAAFVPQAVASTTFAAVEADKITVTYDGPPNGRAKFAEQATLVILFHCPGAPWQRAGRTVVKKGVSPDHTNHDLSLEPCSSPLVDGVMFRIAGGDSDEDLSTHAVFLNTAELSASGARTWFEDFTK